jgi:hypothetical protein
MPRLFLHNRQIETIFELLGEKENDITYSVGWALYRSPCFLREFLKAGIGFEGETEPVILRLQHHKGKAGITDIELELPEKFHIIVEAKSGWNLPGMPQLEKYAKRLQESPAKQKRFLILSECSPEYTKYYLENTEVGGIPVVSLSWQVAAGSATKAARDGSHAEKRLIQELLAYLGRIMTMQQIDSNRVYVVALASGTPEGWQVSWIDIVKEKRRYFHPLGTSGWPKDPPNYIAFRYHGRLQSIHHIEGYEVFTDPHEHFPEIPKDEWGPSYLYRLGPGFAPAEEVRTGNIYRNGRVWCMLDTLFTSKTISQARDLSKKRQERATSS